jgi:hypothetical protein
MDPDTTTDWIGVSYGLVCFTLAAVAIYALAYPKFIAAKYFAKEGAVLDDLEGFLTARKSQSRWRIAFSFYAGSVGAWAITTPANYATFAGWVGMTFYALACGVPIIVLAFFGACPSLRPLPAAPPCCPFLPVGRDLGSLPALFWTPSLPHAWNVISAASARVKI